MADKINVEIAASYDDKDAKKALADAEKIDGLKPEFEVDADVDRVLAAFNQVEAEAKAVAETAEVLGRALGPDLAAKADTTAVVQGLRDMGLTMDQIKANADQLGGKLKELSDADVGGKMGASLGTARGKMDELGASASSSRSVLANMVGNSVQDLGALGGIAGSAGVAIGQMGEYAADAASNGDKLGSILKNFGTVAGPVAVLAVGMELLGRHMKKAKEEQKALADATNELVDALVRAEEEGMDLDVALDELAQNKVNEIVSNLGDDTDDVAGAFQHFKLDVNDLTRAFRDGEGPIVDRLNDLKRYRAEIDAGRDGIKSQIQLETEVATAHGMTRDQLVGEIADLEALDSAFGTQIETQRKANEQSKSAVDILGLDHDARAASITQMESYVGWLEEQGIKHKAAADAATAERQEQERLVTASEQHREAIANVNMERERVDARAELREERNAVDDVTEAYERMHDEISDRKSLLQLQGDFDTLRDKAAEAWTASAEGAEDAEEKQRDYQIAQIDTINNALEYISTVESIPAKAVTDIEALIDQGKYNEALTALEILSQPRSVTLQARLDEALLAQQLAKFYASHGIDPRFGARAAGGITGNEMTLLGEDGPEFVKLPSGSTVIPAPITSAMMHAPGYGGSGTFTVNVNMPKGSRGVDVVKQITGQARRSGRRYGTPVVHYASAPR